jgi:hypothetical protein
VSILLDKHAPLKSKEIKNNNNSNRMNEYYLMAMRARRQCERQWHKYNTPLFRSYLRCQVSYCTSLASKLKSIFYSNIIASCGSVHKIYGLNLTSFWLKSQKLFCLMLPIPDIWPTSFVTFLFRISRQFIKTLFFLIL